MSSKVKDSIAKLEGAWAAAGFSLVLIIVGLPIWWWTTTVYRAALPYSRINQLSSAHNAYHVVHLSIIYKDHLRFKKEIKNHLNEISKENDNHIRFLVSGKVPEPQEEKLLNSFKSIESLDRNLNFKKIHHSGSISIYVLPSNMSFSQSTIHLGIRRVVYFLENGDVKLLSKVIHSMAISPLASINSNKQHKEKFQRMRQVPTEPGYDVTLTLMLPQPHLIRAEWNISEAVEEYLEPLARQLKHISDLRIRSQILYMTSMRINPKWSSTYKHYSLPEQQLPHTINAIEAKLGSFVSTRPSLHFIIYVPSDIQTPLQIHTKDGEPLPANSFLVPRWGGIMIHNPPDELLKKENKTFPLTFKIDFQWVMSTVILQLHKLFPIPSVINHPEVSFIGESFTNVLKDWQLDGLARARVLSYLINIRITLQSLCDLVGEISNMVVSDEVAGLVWSAVDDWDACLQASREGRLKEATIYCKDAFVFSDAAFFHPSMLALLYFPDNQKYAIYVPLFLPVSIPVVLSLKTNFKLLKFKTKTQ